MTNKTTDGTTDIEHKCYECGTPIRAGIICSACNQKMWDQARGNADMLRSACAVKGEANGAPSSTNEQEKTNYEKELRHRRCECCPSIDTKLIEPIGIYLCDECIKKIDARANSGLNCEQCGVAIESGELCATCIHRKELDIFDAVRVFREKNSPSILARADQIINGQKRDEYGPVEESFKRIAIMWSVIFNIPVRPLQVALAMDALKTVRELNKHSDDSLLDKAGYVGLADKVKHLPSPMEHIYK